MVGSAPGRPVKIGEAYLSAILPRSVVLQHEGSMYYSLGNAVWAGLVWPLLEVAMDTYEVDASQGARWVYVCNPDIYFVRAHGAIRTPVGLRVQMQGPAQPLVLAALNMRQQKWSFEVLLRLCIHYELGTTRTNSRDELLAALAAHVGADVNLTLRRDSIVDDAGFRDIVNDPLFSAAFEELDPEDQQEFDCVRKTKRKERVRTFMDAFATRRGRAAKAKAKAKAKRARVAAADAVAADEVVGAAAAVAADEVVGTAALVAVDEIAGADAVAADEVAGAAAAVADDEVVGAAALVAVDGIAGVAAVAGEAAALDAEYERALRRTRAEPFGHKFILAEVYSHHVLRAWSCRCFLHRSCNKTLSISLCSSAAEAKHKIMQWCVQGIGLEDRVGHKKKNIHMDIEPNESADPFLPLEEIQRRVRAL